MLLSFEKFQIYQRQYDIIIKQAADNLPHETGGFVGGKNGLITGILPAFNKHIGNTRETFGLESDDILRAHEFFAHHQLQYFGIYHTHPSGVAIPSHQDLKNNQKYLFIIGIESVADHEFAIYETHGYHTQRIPLEILPDSGMSVLDIQTGQKKAIQNDLLGEAGSLSQMVEDMKRRQLKYPKFDSDDPFGQSGFNTIA